jgi:hypothetical protein
MIWITQARHIKNYEIWIKFNDGIDGIVDLESTITNDHREIFRELEDEEQFKRFRVDDDTIVWENGLDLAPEYLYELALKTLKKVS